jgi:hypothetical protein
MPVEELPEEFLRPIGSPSDSSLSSNSSDVILINAHYLRNSRSPSTSSSILSTRNESRERNVYLNASINHENSEQEPAYQPIKLPTEPTLEELLVNDQKSKS